MATLKTTKKFEISMLSEREVTVTETKVVTIRGVESKVGKGTSTTYKNSTSDREKIQSKIPEPYLSAIMTLWGDSPIMDAPVEATPEENENTAENGGDN